MIRNPKSGTHRQTKSPYYREATRWIAQNDEPTWLDEDRISGLISVVMIADIFGLSPEDVARAVIFIRTFDK